MERTDIYWQGHRVGSLSRTVTTTVDLADWLVSVARVISLELPPVTNIQVIAAMNEVHFDRAFAELRGITGVELEPTETEEVSKDIDAWLQTR